MHPLISNLFYCKSVILMLLENLYENIYYSFKMKISLYSYFRDTSLQKDNIIFPIFITVRKRIN